MKDKIQKTQDHASTHAASSNNETVEVLYQKMGSKWFAFSMIDDEVFVGSISEDEIEEAASRKTKVTKIVGNS